MSDDKKCPHCLAPMKPYRVSNYLRPGDPGIPLEVRTRNLELDKLHYARELCAANILLREIGASKFLDEMRWMFTYEVMGMRRERSGSFEYPRDWWQAFKQRWFPKWALRRWPVVMERLEWHVEARTLFPEIATGKWDRDHAIIVGFVEP